MLWFTSGNADRRMTHTHITTAGQQQQQNTHTQKCVRTLNARSFANEWNWWVRIGSDCMSAYSCWVVITTTISKLLLLPFDPSISPVKFTQTRYVMKLNAIRSFGQSVRPMRCRRENLAEHTRETIVFVMVFIGSNPCASCYCFSYLDFCASDNLWYFCSRQ